MNARLPWSWSALVLCAFLASFAPLSAQDGTLTLTAAFEPAKAKPGDKVVLVLKASVTEGWHAYGTLETTNPQVALAADKVKTGGLVLDGAPVIPPGERKMLGSLETFPLPNEFEVRQAMTVPAGMAAGAVEISGKLDYGICNDSGCLPPDEAEFTARLTVEGGGAPAGAGAGAATQEPKPRTETKPGLKIAPDDKLTVRARVVPSPARAGEQVKLVLEVTVAPGYHAYGTKNEVGIPIGLDAKKLKASPLEPAGAAKVPFGAPKLHHGMTQFWLTGTFEVEQALRVPAGTKPGTVTIGGELTHMVCDDNLCDPPGQEPFEVALPIEAGEPRGEFRAAASPTPPAPAPRSGEPPANGDDAGSSWWALILACIGGGLFALAMPCTYPMIPITFSFFTKQAEKRGGNVLGLALTYGFGIIAMFVIVGVALSAVIIDVANHWVTNSVIGAAFLLFAFTLFGWINLQPPRFLTNAASKASSAGGLLGIFFMGAALVITSFTCTAPIVGTLIANVATAGVARVAFGMAIFGATMALPFVLLALMPTRVKAMPRSGEWMETLKVSLGFVELAATLKFVSMVDIALDWNALPRELFLLLIVAIFALWALYLFGILRKAGTANDGVGAGRMASGMAVTLVATYLLFGAMGYKLDFYMTAFAPPYSAPLVGTRAAAANGASRAADTHVIVKDDGDKALEVAKASDKLLLYNFTGFN
jgi:thiol:disulfide interchange protein